MEDRRGWRGSDCGDIISSRECVFGETVSIIGSNGWDCWGIALSTPVVLDLWMGNTNLACWRIRGRRLSQLPITIYE
ncbi:unnamed protein product [Allacma fusca]|uniref:Uncharacterized protein n=1 Tax=Allacma fusca TaxID=39272 RepID=A0A8J2PKC6_9HEXA|nr:unnamed protein product [Allacma fusca]